LRLRCGSTLPADTDPNDHDLGQRFYQGALSAWKETQPRTVRTALFGCGTGVYVVAEAAVFWHTIIERLISFDWSEAHNHINQIEEFQLEAREIWPTPDREFDSAKRESRDGRQTDQNADKPNEGKKRRSRHTDRN
jgi:hypothetical protein